MTDNTPCTCEQNSSSEKRYSRSDVADAIESVRDNAREDTKRSDDVKSYRIGAVNVLKYLD